MASASSAITIPAKAFQDYPALATAKSAADIPPIAFEKYPALAQAFPDAAAVAKQKTADALAAYNKVFNTPWENAPTRGTALDNYGGVYFGVPGLSPSSMPVPSGGWEAYQKRVSTTPGAGLAALGIDPRDPNMEAKVKAWIDYNKGRGTGFWQQGAWGDSFGREDARVPGFAAMKQKYPNAPDYQILDAVMREQYGQSALPPRSFDIADVLVPLGEIALGAMTGGPWASMALGGIHGGVNNGLLSGILGAAGGAGAGGFGADIVSQGLKGALANQIPDFSNILSSGASLPAAPTTPSGWVSSAADTINSIPSSFFSSDNTNKGIGALVPTAAFGAQATGALKPSQTVSAAATPAPVRTTTPTSAFNIPSLNIPALNPFKPAATIPTAVPATASTVTKPVAPVTPTAPNIAAIRQQFNNALATAQPIRKASGGMLPTSKTEMNPMGGAPASTYGLASFHHELPTAKGGYLDGPGDGMSDSIHATIDGKQPARLADGEFVIPADVVSHIGNGSSKAGAKHLYAMMDRIRHARTGNKKQGKQINAQKFLPA